MMGCLLIVLSNHFFTLYVFLPASALCLECHICTSAESTKCGDPFVNEGSGQPKTRLVACTYFPPFFVKPGVQPFACTIPHGPFGGGRNP